MVQRITAIKPAIRLPVGPARRLASRKQTTCPASSVRQKHHLVSITVPDNSLTNPAAVCGRIRQLRRQQLSLQRAAAWTRRSSAYRSRPPPPRPPAHGLNTVHIRVPSHLLVNPVAVMQRRMETNDERIQTLRQRL